MPVKLLGFLTSTLAAAAPRDKTPAAGPAEAAKRPSDTPPPNCLDRSITDELGASLRPRGVQKKTFLKRFRAELIRERRVCAPAPPNSPGGSITAELGASLRPRGVQKKTFLKRFRAELIGHGGIYASDLMSSSYLYGGAV